MTLYCGLKPVAAIDLLITVKQFSPKQGPNGFYCILLCTLFLLYLVLYSIKLKQVCSCTLL